MCRCNELAVDCYCDSQGALGEWCRKHDRPLIPEESTCLQCEGEQDEAADRAEGDRFGENNRR